MSAGAPRRSGADDAAAFYNESLRELVRSGVPFLVGGTFAVCLHTGISRGTKDLDVFCRAGDYPRILGHFQRLRWQVAVEDERWLAKVCRGEHFFDVIFNSTVAVTPVTDEWFAWAQPARLHDIEVRLLSPTELIWSKAFVQDRRKYDGADIVHLILRRHHDIDWRRLLTHMEQYWEVLLIHLLNFRFIYPSERHRVPSWLVQELLRRVEERETLPAPQTRICRGRLFSRSDYLVDVKEWGFADVVGEGGGGNG